MSWECSMKASLNRALGVRTCFVQCACPAMTVLYIQLGEPSTFGGSGGSSVRHFVTLPSVKTCWRVSRPISHMQMLCVTRMFISTNHCAHAHIERFKSSVLFSALPKYKLVLEENLLLIDHSGALLSAELPICQQAVRTSFGLTNYTTM